MIDPSLQDSVDRARASLESLHNVLDEAQKMAQGLGLPVKNTYKQAILDSYVVKKFHRDYHEWESEQKKQFGAEITSYNKKYAQLGRLCDEAAEVESRLFSLGNSIQIPHFLFSIQTLEQYEGGKFLERITKDPSGHYPRTISTHDLFSLDGSPDRYPNYQDFRGLVNLEYRLRTQLQIKYEVLMHVRSSLTANNSRWAERDRKLDQFLNRDLVGIVEEVEKIKKSEHEDLKYFEEDYGLVTDGFEENEQENENDNEQKHEHEIEKETEIETNNDNEEKKDETKGEHDHRLDTEAIEDEAIPRIGTPSTKENNTPIPESTEDMVLD